MIPWSQETAHGGSTQMQVLWILAFLWVLPTKLSHSQGFQVAEGTPCWAWSKMVPGDGLGRQGEGILKGFFSEI